MNVLCSLFFTIERTPPPPPPEDWQPFHEPPPVPHALENAMERLRVMEIHPSIEHLPSIVIEDVDFMENATHSMTEDYDLVDVAFGHRPNKIPQTRRPPENHSI